MNGAQIATSVFTLIAGVGIFLFGCNLMSAEIQATGGGLKKLFDKISKSKLAGVGMGTVFTAAIQSSGATAVTVISFVNAGIMSLAQAVTVIFGANIGTTVTGQLAALGGCGDGISVSTVLAAFTGVGAFMTMFAKKPTVKSIGGIITGFGMLFAGLAVMSGAAECFSENLAVKSFLAAFKNPLLTVLMGAAITAIVQSSSVTTAMTVTMVSAGLITLDQGIYITMGSNIGSCVTAILAGLASTKNAKRVALAHLLFNVCGVAVFMAAGLVMSVFGTGYGKVLEYVPCTPEIRLAFFHTAFNIITTLFMLPLTDLLVKVVTKLVPDKRRCAWQCSRIKVD